MSISAQSFFAKVERFAKTMPSSQGSHHFMHDESKRQRQHRDYTPYFAATVAYRNRWIAVAIFCDPKGDGKGKVFCRVVKDPLKSSGNTQHVTLTNTNVLSGGIFYVEPKLGKCGGVLSCAPRKIGQFPRQDLRRTQRLLLGPLDKKLLPRMFELAISKFDSIQSWNAKLDMRSGA